MERMVAARRCRKPERRMSLVRIVVRSGLTLAVVGAIVSASTCDHWCGGNRHSRAQLDLERIAEALQAYQSLHPDVGIPEPSPFPVALCEAGPHGELPPLDPDILDSGRFLDPWGHDYVYVKHDDGSFDLISYGADGREGGDGDDADLSVHRET